MHVLISFLVGLAVWLAAVIIYPEPLMIIIAPLVVSGIVMICCWAPWRRRAPHFEHGVLGSSLER